jgi:hypothetical protein
MKLSDYLKQQKPKPLSAAAFGRLVGRDRSTVGRWLKGEKPDPDMMETIMRETDGAVQPNDWFDLPAAEIVPQAGLAA